MARYLTFSDESFLDSLELIDNSQDRSKAILYDLSVHAQHPSASVTCLSITHKEAGCMESNINLQRLSYLSHLSHSL